MQSGGPEQFGGLTPPNLTVSGLDPPPGGWPAHVPSSLGGAQAPDTGPLKPLPGKDPWGGPQPPPGSGPFAGGAGGTPTNLSGSNLNLGPPQQGPQEPNWNAPLPQATDPLLLSGNATLPPGGAPMMQFQQGGGGM